MAANRVSGNGRRCTSFVFPPGGGVHSGARSEDLAFCFVLFLQALGIARGALGRENTVVATFLHKLGHAYEDLGMADDAEAMFTEEREVRSVIERGHWTT